MLRRIATVVLVASASTAMTIIPAQSAKAPKATAPTAMTIVSHAAGFLTSNESTPAGIRDAAKAGVKRLEFDVQFSKGGAKVVQHDATLTRATDCTGKIAETTWTQLKKCGVYSLNEMLDAARENHMDVLLHLKANDSVARAKDTLNEVTRNKMTDHVKYFASNTGFMNNMFKAGAKREHTAFLLKSLKHWSYDHPELWYFEGPVNAELVAKAKARGAKVGTVDDRGLTETDAANLGMTMFMSNDLATSLGWKKL